MHEQVGDGPRDHELLVGADDPHLDADGVVGFRTPKVRALYETTYFVGLRKAGMPEE
jgi:hypothetical protein